MERTDALLLDRWRTERDPEAFSEIVQRHWNTVFSCCRRVLGDAAQAGAGMKIVLPDSCTIVGHVAVEGTEADGIRIAVTYPDEDSFPRLELIPNAHGVFKTSDLGPGKVLLKIWFPTNGIEQLLDLKAGETVSVDYPAPFGNAHVAGRLSKNGEPFGQASLELTRQMDGFKLVAVTTSAQDGTFAFEQVWPGGADLAVTHYDEATDKVSAYEYQIEVLEGETPIDLEVN